MSGLLTTGILQQIRNADVPATLPGDYGSGAHVAYSLRKVVSAYAGPVVRVRRWSDNTESDFNATEVIDGTLTTWVGGLDGFVRTLYNQTVLTGRNLEQTTWANQPIIVEAGVLYTENSKPSMKFDATRFLTAATSSHWVFLHVDKSSVFSVQRVNGANPNTLYAIWATGHSVSGTRTAYLRYDDRSASGYNNDWVHIVGNSGVVVFNQKPVATGQFETDKLLTARVHSHPRGTPVGTRSYVGVNSNTLTNLNIDGVLPGTGNPTTPFRLGEANGNWRLNGAISEVIIYTDGDITNMQSYDSDIDTEMKTHYSIT